MKFQRLSVNSCLLISLGLAFGCAHESLTPEVSNVKAGREKPKGDCVELSTVTGSTSTVHGTPEQALEDLKKETANKGGNYVRVDQYSSYGTAVTGTAYRCQ
jgi:hypothetical protein